MQTDSRFFNLLGLARRAGKISWGHDTALFAIKSGKAKLCILASDVSERLKNEFSRECTYNGRNIQIIELEKTMEDMNLVIGVKTGVMTVDDDGFVNSLKKYILINGR
ncbi:MAG: hypothetical protein E7536_06570 [Ruminococcaceae bacterium]|nr:hypothetical protein [Oscillospiraceae bacterium]